MKSSSLYWFSTHDLGRDDETPDGDFYTKPRFVDHLDSCALETVEQIYGRLLRRLQRSWISWQDRNPISGK